MKPFELLGQTTAPDGGAIQLVRRSREYLILADGAVLMSSRMHGSEESLASVGLESSRTLRHPSVLIGGLGMGFTLRATLDLLPPNASVQVVEVLPAVVDWNHGPLGPLAGHPLSDPRVTIQSADVATTLRTSVSRFDAILLDVDNGPAAFSSQGNAALYSSEGIAAAHRALRIEGVLAVWAAQEDGRFEQRLRHAGFVAKTHRVRARQRKGSACHIIFLARRTR